MSLDPKKRKYIYGVLVAVFPLLAALGWVTEELGTQLLLVAAAVLGIAESGLAFSKVEKAPDADYEE